MKKTSLFLLIYVITMGVGVATIHSWSPFSADDWEDLGDKIVGAFEKGVSFLGKTFKNVTDLVEEAFKKIVECSSVVGLGTQWAGQKAGYEVARASLDVAEQSLEAAKAGASAFTTILDQLAKAAGKGINIKSMTFETYTSKLLAGETPRITIEATILGKDIKGSYALDMSKPFEAAKSFAQDVINKIGI